MFLNINEATAVKTIFTINQKKKKMLKLIVDPLPQHFII